MFLGDKSEEYLSGEMSLFILLYQNKINNRFQYTLETIPKNIYRCCKRLIQKMIMKITLETLIWKGF